MVLAAHQPQYLPYLGFFDKLKRADIFVLLDDVQFKKNEWQNRNRVKGEKGLIWLTIPVKHNFGQRIMDVVIADKTWQKKHFQTLRTYYSKAPGFHLINKFSIFQKEYEKLVDVNIDSIKIICDILEIKTPIYLSSPLKIKKEKTERLIAICKEFSAKYYLSGIGAKNYLDEKLFNKEGIEVIWQDFKHPTYNQLWGEFVPNLSAIDIILCEGEKSKNFI